MEYPVQRCLNVCDVLQENARLSWMVPHGLCNRSRYVPVQLPETTGELKSNNVVFQVEEATVWISILASDKDKLLVS